MWPVGPVSTVPTEPAFAVVTDSADAVDPAVDEVLDELVGLEVVVVPADDVGDEEHAAAVIASPMSSPLRASARPWRPRASRRPKLTTDLVSGVDVELSMSISELG